MIIMVYVRSYSNHNRRGESGIGNWTIVVKDTKVNQHNGTFLDWRLTLWGEAVDPAIQPLHPLPEMTDDDHDYEDVPVVTTTVETEPPKTDPPVHPTDHVDRPVNEKPPETSASTTSLPSQTTGTTTTAATTAAATSMAGSSENFLPSFFPTFGASKRTQTWIYTSFGVIIIFCVGLGSYFYVQRQKRLRSSPRDDYEFEMIQDEDDTQALNGHSGRTQRRGGELYNAFAEDSDADELFDEEDDDELYRDHPSGEDYGKGKF